MKIWVGAAALVCSFVAPRLARADTHDELGHYERYRRANETPQNVAIELRFGHYHPEVDDGLNGTPYDTTFGSKKRYFMGLEVDWQVLRIPGFGTFGPGVGIGYTKATGKAPFKDGSGISDQDTALAVVPMYAVAVLRADVIARETLVPLVPYVKAGLGYALWSASDAGIASRDANGVIGHGHSYGYHVALGGMLMLDAFDRADARAADSSIGLNHSYIFAEWFKSKLDGFGSTDRMSVGTSSWAAGLAMEF
jgi:hypothetical protein